METLGKLVEAMPDLAAQALPQVVQVIGDRDRDVREDAVKAFARIVETSPRLVAQALPQVVQALSG